jgi:beta-glucosidase-like glycosyl hydrolase
LNDSSPVTWRALKGTNFLNAASPAFPASIVLGSTFNPKLAREQDVLIGREARAKGTTCSSPAE